MNDSNRHGLTQSGLTREVLDSAEAAAWRGARAARVDCGVTEAAATHALDRFVDRWLAGRAPSPLEPWCFQVAKRAAWAIAGRRRQSGSSAKSVPEADWFARLPDASLAVLTKRMRLVIAAYVAWRTVSQAAKALARDRAGVRRMLRKAATRILVLRKGPPPPYWCCRNGARDLTGSRSLCYLAPAWRPSRDALECSDATNPLPLCSSGLRLVLQQGGPRRRERQQRPWNVLG